jgi:hypothetical protein
MGKNILYQLGVFAAKFCGRGDPGNIIKKIPSRFPGSAHKSFISEVSSGQDPGWTECFANTDYFSLLAAGF